LIFIPDISGFTRFVNAMEVDHAQHIIEELLEVLIDANEIGLELSEIEGDALLFYRFGKVPTTAKLLGQIQRMYVRFHAHLKKYETHRICSCGVCMRASNLTLKFVAHYGEVAENKVKDRSGLFGREVIVAHRLLKNEVEWEEYALVTKELVEACETWRQLPEMAWSEVQQAEEDYDFGRAGYWFFSLESLREQVPEPQVKDYGLPEATREILHLEEVVEAPIDMVFDVLSDLSFRHEWMVGLKGSDRLNHAITQAGSTHRCIINENERDPFFVSHSFELDPDKVTFVESDRREGLSMVYVLQRVSRELTRVELHILMKPHWLKVLVIDLFFKKKLYRINEQSIANFSAYCKKLVDQQSEHPRRIVLPQEVKQERLEKK